MGKLWLEGLSLSHFRSVTDSIDIDLPRRGVLLLRAKNLDTGGSSGAGKSTLLLGINAAMDCCPYPMTENQSWLTSEPVQVQVRLGSPAGAVVRNVGSKSSLKVGDGKPLTAAKPIAEKMRELIGMDTSMVQALTYAPQDDDQDFLKLSNADKQELLSAALGLKALEEEVDKASKAVVEATKAKDTAAVAVQLAEAALAGAQERLVATGSKVIVDLQTSCKMAAQKVVETEEVLRQERIVADRLLAEFRVEEAAVALRLKKFKASLEPKRLEAEAARLQTSALVIEEPDGSEVIRLGELLRVGKTKLAAVQAQDNASKANFDREVSSLNSQIEIARIQAKQIPQLIAKIAATDTELASIRGQVCPTCDQQWIAAAGKIADFERKRNELKKQHEQLLAQVDAVPALEDKKRSLVFEPDPLLEQLQELVSGLQQQSAAEQAKQGQAKQLLLAEIQTKRAEARAHEAQVLAKIATDSQSFSNENEAQLRALAELKSASDRNFSELTHQNQMATLALKNATAKLLDAETVRDGNLSAVLAAEESLKARQAALEAITAGLRAEEDFVKLVGREGFLGTIFDEVLAEISQETNSILSRVPNTAHIVLEFRSEFENKSGKVRKEIRPFITIGGFAAPLKSGCSGGMLAAVRLAVRLAVRRVISQRTGIELCWQCLDEPFNGLDPICKEAVMEILVEAGKQDLILVVDHGTEFKEMFTQTIDLEFERGVTRMRASS